MTGPARRPRDPPGPSLRALWRDRRRLETNPPAVWEEWRREFGDLVRVRVLGKTYYFAFHPRQVKHVMKTRAANYVRESPAAEVLRLLQGYGLATITGDRWRRRRKLLAPWFFARNVGSYAGLMMDMVTDYLAPWEAKAAAGEPVELVAEMISLAVRIGSSTLVSTDLKPRLPELEAIIRELQDYAAARLASPLPPPTWLPTPANRRFRRAMARLDEMIYAVIDERAAAGDAKDDVLGMLLALRDPETGAPLTRLEIRDELMTIAGAAHDTTGISLTWAFLHLARHPGIRDRFHAEVDRVLGGRWPTAADLPAMPLGARILEETMRLTPPIYALMRQVVEEDEIDGYRIRPGAYMLTSPYVTQRHPGFWDRPAEFDPDRFLPENAAAIDPYSRLAFGAGPHVCIGKNFALLDTQLILAAVAGRYRLDLRPGQAVPIRAGFSYRPAGRVEMALTRR